MADRVAINRPRQARPRQPRVWYHNVKLVVIFTMGVVTTLYSLTEIVIALRYASLVMLTDGLHNFSDAGALAVGFWAENKKLKFGTEGLTYGWRRTELLGGLFNGFFLLSMSVFVMLEAIPKFITPEAPNRDGDMQFIIVSGAGIFINVVGTILFSIFGGGHGHSHGGGGGHGHAHGGGKSKEKGGHGHAHGAHSPHSPTKQRSSKHAHEFPCDSETDDDDMHDQKSLVPSQSSLRPSSGSQASNSSSGLHRQLNSAIGTPRQMASTHAHDLELAASLPAHLSGHVSAAWDSHSDDGHGHDHGHGHGHGSASHDDEEEEHGHSHGESKGGHGHSHGSLHEEEEHGHAHGSHGHHDESDEEHGHAHGSEYSDHGHAHGKVKKISSGSLHAHSVNHESDEELVHAHAHGSASPRGGHGHAHGHHDDDDDDDDHGHHSARDHNMWGLFIHFLGDVLTSILVLGVGLIYYFTTPEDGSLRDDWVNYMDPAASVVSVGIIVASVWPLIKACSWILLQSSPSHVNLTRLRRDILALPAVRDVHELHVWQLVDGVSIGSVHVVTDSAFDLQDLVGSVKSVLHRHGIHSSSIQPELQPRAPALHPSSSSACVVAGSCVQNCEGETCCPPTPLLADA